MIIFNNFRSIEKQKTDDYINRVYPNGSDSYGREILAAKPIYYRYINYSPGSLSYCNFVLDVVGKTDI